VASSDPLPKPSTAFVIVTFTVAIIIGAVVAYLGIIGVLGGPIP
jgi:hypothetical protein